MHAAADAAHPMKDKSVAAVFRSFSLAMVCQINSKKLCRAAACDDRLSLPGTYLHTELAKWMVVCAVMQPAVVTIQLKFACDALYT
jgi:hypothetical protein